MLYREIIAVCSQIHTKHTNALCGQNVELLNVKLAVHIVGFTGLTSAPDGGGWSASCFGHFTAEAPPSFKAPLQLLKLTVLLQYSAHVIRATFP
jgi:hypothetical protein